MRRHSRGRSAGVARSHPSHGSELAPEAASVITVGDDRAVLSGYRLLRRLASGDRATVYLASSLHPADAGAPPSAPVALRIYEAGGDDARVAAEISAMTADATGTLPALVDVTALDDGRCVLAVERIGGPTLARLLTERTLEPGEAVTILAPIAIAVAGLAEAGFVHTRLAPSDVLVDGIGRPRLIGLGAVRRLDEVSSAIERTELLRAGHVALSQLVATVAEATRPHGSLERAVAAIRDAAAARPFVRSEALLERSLFESAAAAPVRGLLASTHQVSSHARCADAFDPSGAEASAAGAEPSRVVPTEASPPGGPEASPRTGVLRTLAALAQVPAEAFDYGARLADADPVTSLAARLRRALSARRRAVLVAALVGGAALVILLTLVPPAEAGSVEETGGASSAPVSPGAEPETQAATPGAAAENAAEGDVEVDLGDAGEQPDGGGAVDAATTEDPVAATAALLALREECLGALDAACLEQVDQAGSAIERADLAALSGAREGTAIPTDTFAIEAVAIAAEMGDAVLMTVPYDDPEREPASLLVMRSEAGWRLRELFD